MKKTKLLIFFIFLSSCNQYFGSVDPDYMPSNEVTEIFSKIQKDTNTVDVELGDVIYPKVNNPALKINNIEIDKIINTEKNSVVNFFNYKIFLSKNKNIYEIDKNSNEISYEYKVDLNKEEQFLHFLEYKDKIYVITNKSRLFMLDGQNATLLTDYDIFINNTPIVLDEIIIIFSVFGDIYQINLEDNSIIKKGSFNNKPGTSLNSNNFEDKLSIYYMFNSGTLLTFNKNNYEFSDNYILEDLNILTSLGIFSELVDTPFSYNDHLYFLDRSGKISVFNPVSLEILWEFDINLNILDYMLLNNGYLILLTYDKILILTDKGNLIHSYTHNKELPISIFNIQENIYLISEDGISKLNLNNESEDSFYKNKFTSNLDIYYQDQNIYLKDDKSLFKLGE